MERILTLGHQGTCLYDLGGLVCGQREGRAGSGIQTSPKTFPDKPGGSVSIWSLLPAHTRTGQVGHSKEGSAFASGGLKGAELGQGPKDGQWDPVQVSCSIAAMPGTGSRLPGCPAGASLCISSSHLCRDPPCGTCLGPASE